MVQPTAETLTRTIRVTPEQWERIEKIAREREVSANRLAVELVVEALDRRKWPRAELDIQVAKAALFAAQILPRGLTAAGRKDEVEEIPQFVASLVHECAANPPPSSATPPPQLDMERGSEKAERPFPSVRHNGATSAMQLPVSACKKPASPSLRR